MHNYQYRASDTINFNVYGGGDHKIITSPFFPFESKIVYEYFTHLNESKYTVIISDFITKRKFSSTYFSVENIVNIYARLIEYIDSPNINLVGFGLFSHIFLIIADRYSKLINSLNLIEPDFLSSVFAKVFDSDKRVFFKTKKLSEFYLEKTKIPNINKYLSKVKIKNIHHLYNEVSKSINQKMLKDILHKNINMSVFWKMMVKETWPLAQILEESRCRINYLDKNFFYYFHNNDHYILDTILKNSEIE